MAQPEDPRPQQIVKLNQENKLICDKNILRQIFLNPKTKDKQVCVVSITGSLQQGKSFFLNFLLRSLKTKLQLKNASSIDCLKPENDSISGFSLKRSDDGHTKGILVWPEIFVTETSPGEEIAIVLLDSQGTVDSNNKDTQENSAAIFALTTLLSSFQILSLKKGPNEYDLTSFKCFPGYTDSTCTLDSKDNSKLEPLFQKLYILIRDWSFHFEYDYGLSGGEKLLQNLINSGKTAKEIQSKRDSILKLFEEIHCCLLPHPGNVTTSDAPKFSETNAKFIQCMESFVSKILSPENLVPKIISKEPIKVGHLYFLIQTYCDQLGGELTPSIPSLYMAIHESQLKITSADCEEMYVTALNKITQDEKALSNDRLEEHHFKEKEKTLKWFDEKIIETDAETKKKLKKQLKDNLEHKFAQFRKQNIIKKEKEQNLAQENAQKERDKVLQELHDIKSKQQSMESLLEQNNKDDQILQMIKNCGLQNEQLKEEFKKIRIELANDKQKNYEEKMAQQEKCKELYKEIKTITENSINEANENEKLRALYKNLEEIVNKLSKETEILKNLVEKTDYELHNVERCVII